MNILRLPKLLYSCVAFCCCQALTVSLSAQQQKVDTARTYSIPEVTVAEAYHTREVRAMAPTQVFSKEELKSLNVYNRENETYNFLKRNVQFSLFFHPIKAKAFNHHSSGN